MRFSFALTAVGFVLGIAMALVTIGTPAATPPPVTPLQAVAPPGPATVCMPAPAHVRAGQVIWAGLPQVHRGDEAAVRQLLDVGVGGFLVADSNVYNAAQVRRLVTGLREASSHALLIATDEEPGRISRFTPVLGRFSSPRVMAERDTVADVRTFATQLGTELVNLGIDLDFAPVADVDGGPPTGFIGDRSFSGDPRRARTYSTAFSRGLMAGGLMPGPKYFPGQGRSRLDSHARRVVIEASRAELEESDLEPFVAQIALGVPVIMTSHATFTALDPERPASLSPAAYRLLRELGFDGVAVTDRLGAASIMQRGTLDEAAVAAIAAGADAVTLLDGRHAEAIRDALVSAVETGELPDERLTEAAARVYALKGQDPGFMTCQTEIERERIEAVSRKAL